MVRGAWVLGLAGVLAVAAGCRHACGDRGFLSSVGRPAGAEACPVPVGTGVPVSGGGIGPGFAGTLMPGSAGLGGPAEQLPPPANLTIPPTSVPLAPPTVAPPGSDGFGVLPAPKGGVPVKSRN